MISLDIREDVSGLVQDCTACAKEGCRCQGLFLALALKHDIEQDDRLGLFRDSSRFHDLIEAGRGLVCRARLDELTLFLHVEDMVAEA